MSKHIADEAVRAAAAAFYVNLPPGAECHPIDLANMRAALEAAAPHMLAVAWDEGHESGYAEGADVDLMVQAATNPYRPAK